jgi:hypothetical protein
MQKSGFVARKCVKCGGSVYLDRDQFGWYEQCLQCGFVSDLKDIAVMANTGEKGAARVTAGTKK